MGKEGKEAVCMDCKWFEQGAGILTCNARYVHALDFMRRLEDPECPGCPVWDARSTTTLVNTTVRVDPEDMEEIERIAWRKGMNRSDVLREAIKVYIEMDIQGQGL